MPIRFEWDARKERRNLQKHGVGFDEASTVFADTLSSTIPGPDHSDDEEERWVTVGLSHRQRLLVVVHTRMNDGSFESSARGRPTPTSGGSMKKVTRETDDMRNHYDFRGGVRGKYAQRYAEGTNVVVLDPDVAEMFPDREAVNEALRAVGQVVRMRERRRARRSKGAAPARGQGGIRARSVASRSGRGG